MSTLLPCLERAAREGILDSFLRPMSSLWSLPARVTLEAEGTLLYYEDSQESVTVDGRSLLSPQNDTHPLVRAPYSEGLSTYIMYARTLSCTCLLNSTSRPPSPCEFASLFCLMQGISCAHCAVGAIWVIGRVLVMSFCVKWSSWSRWNLLSHCAIVIATSPIRRQREIRDWERIDKLRIDKYYTMVRLFVREAIRFCRLPATWNAPSMACPASVVSNFASTSAEERSEQATSSKKRRKQSKKGSANGVSANGGEQVTTGTTHDESLEHGSIETWSEGARWDLELLRGVIEAMEEEIITIHPAPIGLRLHLTDVWAEETFGAGPDMPTEALLVVLSPWLRALVDENTNRVVFKRCVEGVFEWLLKYFPTDEGGEKAGEGDMDTGGERGNMDEERRYFDKVDLSAVQACIFEAASARQVRHLNCSYLIFLTRGPTSLNPAA